MGVGAFRPPEQAAAGDRGLAASRATQSTEHASRQASHPQVLRRRGREGGREHVDDGDAGEARNEEDAHARDEGAATPRASWIYLGRKRMLEWGRGGATLRRGFPTGGRASSCARQLFVSSAWAQWNLGQGPRTPTASELRQSKRLRLYSGELYGPEATAAFPRVCQETTEEQTLRARAPGEQSAHTARDLGRRSLAFGHRGP